MSTYRTFPICYKCYPYRSLLTDISAIHSGYCFSARPRALTIHSQYVPSFVSNKYIKKKKIK